MSNPYRILGVSPSATDEELAGAYKKMAKRFHPDLNPDDPRAAERMGRINCAYEQAKSLRQDAAQTADTAAKVTERGAKRRAAARPSMALPLRLLFALIFVVLLLQLLAVFLRDTAPVQALLKADDGHQSSAYSRYVGSLYGSGNYSYAPGIFAP